jgi:L-amino acid N-acyltransferase YncA
VPSYDPRGVVLAIHDGTRIGMAATSMYPERGFAVSEMTGVLRSYRGRGISIAMKLIAIDYVRECNLRWLRAFRHHAQASAIAINRRLGFVDEDPGL